MIFMIFEIFTTPKMFFFEIFQVRRGPHFSKFRPYRVTGKTPLTGCRLAYRVSVRFQWPGNPIGQSPMTPGFSMGPRTMVYRNHGYRNGAKNDKISDHCFVTNGVRFQWKNELRPVSKRARRDLSLTKGLSLPGRQWIRVILGTLKHIDIFVLKKI